MLIKSRSWYLILMSVPAVCVDATNDSDVSWKWRQCWSSNTARCHILQKYGVQRLNDELSRVMPKSIFKKPDILIPFVSYGHSEGSPCEQGWLSRLLRCYQVNQVVGIKIDAQTALDYLTSHPVLNKTQIVGCFSCVFCVFFIHYTRFFMDNPLAVPSLLTWQVETHQKYVPLSLSLSRKMLLSYPMCR